jgi:hypothetical protein
LPRSAEHLLAIIAVGVLAGAPLSLIPHAAAAQGLFGSLFGDIFGAPQRPTRPYGAPDQEPHAAPPEYRERVGGGSYCVRLCDGRYYPIGRAGNGAFSPARICSAMCPAAQTQVFNGQPEQGVAADGTRYTELPNAFAYRQRVVPNCTCTGHGGGGLAPLDIDSDPTLRPGDVVASPAGLTVFRGAGQLPYRPSDFTPLANSRADLGRLLADVKVDPTAVSITPAQKLATEAAPAPVSRPPPRRPPAEATTRRPEARPPSFFDIFR